MKYLLIILYTGLFLLREKIKEKHRQQPEYTYLKEWESIDIEDWPIEYYVEPLTPDQSARKAGL